VGGQLKKEKGIKSKKLKRKRTNQKTGRARIGHLVQGGNTKISRAALRPKSGVGNGKVVASIKAKERERGKKTNNQVGI